MILHPKTKNKKHSYMSWKVKAHIQLVNLLMIPRDKRTKEQIREIRRLQNKLATNSIRNIRKRLREKGK